MAGKSDFKTIGNPDYIAIEKIMGFITNCGTGLLTQWSWLGVNKNNLVNILLKMCIL